MRLPKIFRRTQPRANAMAITPRPANPNRHGVALAAIMKDEGDHVEDWIRFHLIAGVRHFYLYDDGSTDETVAKARALGGSAVTIVQWRMSAALVRPDRGLSRQVLAYCHAIDNFGPDYRWMGFIDIDEYIVPKAHDTLPDALAGLDAHQNVSLPWTMFGHNGHKTQPNEPVAFAYTARAATRARPILNFKSLLDPSDVTGVRVHRFETARMGGLSVNDAGQLVDRTTRETPEHLTDGVLQLNHYYTRSEAEMRAKLDKGAVSGSDLATRTRKVKEKVDVIEATATQDRAALDFLARHGIKDEAGFRNWR